MNACGLDSHLTEAKSKMKEIVFVDTKRKWKTVATIACPGVTLRHEVLDWLIDWLIDCSDIFCFTVHETPAETFLLLTLLAHGARTRIRQ